MDGLIGPGNIDGLKLKSLSVDIRALDPASRLTPARYAATCNPRMTLICSGPVIGLRSPRTVRRFVNDITLAN